VVKRGGPALFGREWLKSIQLDWKMIKSLTIASDESKCDMTLKDVMKFSKSKSVALKSKSLHSAKYIVKIFQVFLFRLTGHDHIIEYALDTF
jgi:hypothetical protein